MQRGSLATAVQVARCEHLFPCPCQCTYAHDASMWHRSCDHPLPVHGKPAYDECCTAYVFCTLLLSVYLLLYMLMHFMLLQCLRSDAMICLCVAPATSIIGHLRLAFPAFPVGCFVPPSNFSTTLRPSTQTKGTLLSRW